MVMENTNPAAAYAHSGTAITLTLKVNETFTGDIYKQIDGVVDHSSGTGSTVEPTTAGVSVSGRKLTVTPAAPGTLNLTLVSGDGTVRTPLQLVASGVPATITTQPQAIAMYQEGAKLEVLGAVVANAVTTVWQKRAADGTTWADTALTGPTISKASGVAADAGQYRLKVVGTDGVPVYSTEVKVGNLYLVIVADLNGNAGTDKVTQAADRYHYTANVIAGQHYYTARLWNVATGAAVVPADWGLTATRVQAAWTTTDATVVPISNVVPATPPLATSGQMRSDIVSPVSGKTATVTATFGNLKSEVLFTVP
jgi:hypothetical protein